MSLQKITAGPDAPKQFHVIIEIPMKSAPVKYEIDKTTSMLTVDRFLSTSMYYPCNYGYIPQTKADDGDPVDVMVIAPEPIIPGAMVICRAIGLLTMEDEAGLDNKVLAVPIQKVCQLYQNIQTYKDLPEQSLDMIAHFFTHYKDLESNKWAKVGGWSDAKAAEADIRDSMARYAG